MSQNVSKIDVTGAPLRGVKQKKKQHSLHLICRGGLVKSVANKGNFYETLLLG